MLIESTVFHLFYYPVETNRALYKLARQEAYPVHLLLWAGRSEFERLTYLFKS